MCIRDRNESRYQLLIKAAGRKPLSKVLQSVRRYALEAKWSPAALVIDVDPLTLM
jgi:primosomal protein N'